MYKRPVITFYTPTYRRPRYLGDCIASVRAQSLARWEHVVIPDLVGVGIAGVFRAVPSHLDKIHGDYVYFLQDDDVLNDAGVVKAFSAFVASRGMPPVIIAKNEKNGEEYPKNWGARPELGYIDLGSYIVRADVFKVNAHRFGQRYEGDYDFIAALWDQGTPFEWWDRKIARAQQVGLGRPEE